MREIKESQNPARSIQGNHVLMILRSKLTPFFPAIGWYHLLMLAGLGLAIYLGILFVLKEFKKQDLDFFLNILRPKEMVKYVSSELKEKPR